jgi:hypothetical protein
LGGKAGCAPASRLLVQTGETFAEKALAPFTEERYHARGDRCAQEGFVCREALAAPGGIAVGGDGALYVTNDGIYSDVGEVIRIQRRSAFIPLYSLGGGCRRRARPQPETSSIDPVRGHFADDAR